MAESGQHGKNKQQGVHDRNRLDHSGPSEDIGSPPGEVRITAESGWDRFRKPAEREMGPALILRRRKEITCSFSKKNGEFGLCFLKFIEQVISLQALSAFSRNGTAVLAASSDNNGSSSFDVQMEEPVSPPVNLSDQGGPPSGGKRTNGRKRHWRYTVPAVVIVLVLLFAYGMWRFFWAPEPIAKTVVVQAVVGLLSPDDKGEAIRAVRVKEIDIKPFPLLASKPDIGPVVSPTAINLLIMGRDVEANLYDTLMIVSLDPDNGRIRLINIPRDLYVDYSPKAVALIKKILPNINSDPALRKINAAHKLGKLIKYREDSSRFGSPDYDFTADLVEEMFSLSIDDFIYIYPESFKKIVDAFGGVRVDVPYSMRYSDPVQDLKIDLQAGEQLLDGYNAEGFVRFRKGYSTSGKWIEIGDLGRKENQNIFVKAFMEQNLTLGNMGKIINLANRYTEFTETSLIGEVKIGDYAQLGTSLIAKKFITDPVVLDTRYQTIFGHEQFVLGSGVKNASAVSEAGSGTGVIKKDGSTTVKPVKATPKPANSTTDGGVQTAVPSENPATATPEPSATPVASPAPAPSATPVASPAPAPSATPVASPALAPSAPPVASPALAASPTPVL